MNVKETGHLEWLQLDAVVQGLLDTLVGHAEYKQAHFVVFDSTKRPKEQGRGKLSNVREGVGVEVQ